MKYFIAISLCLFAGSLTAQKCDCPSQLDFTINYYEQNNPAFQKVKKEKKKYQQYQAAVKKLKREAIAQTADLCIIQMDQYVALLKDHHSEIGFNLKRQDLSSPEKIADFKNTTLYKQYHKVEVDTTRLIPLLNRKKLADIEGLYSNGGSLQFGIIPVKNQKGKYIGIVLRKTNLLEVGHVLLELTHNEGNQYAISYNVGLLGFNFEKILKTQRVVNGLMPGFGFSKTDTREKKKPYEFKILNDSTNYLRLSDFDAGLTAELNSFYDSIESTIKSKQHLIIDIRDNGGGAERSFFSLLPYIYTKPFELDSALIWVSPENIKRYEEGNAANNQRLIERMKAAKPFSFIPFSEEPMNTWSLDSGTIYPKKVALVYNRGTASSGEGMIVYFQQSEKVITIGENSGGYVGYGNVMIANSPCDKFSIRSTTTQYFEKSKWEFVGIPPQYKPSRSEDWIQFANKKLAFIGRKPVGP